MPPGRSHEQPHEVRDPKHACAPQTEELARGASRPSWPAIPDTVRERFSPVLLEALVQQLRRGADRLPGTDDVGPLPRDLTPLTAAPAASCGAIA